MKKLKCLLGFHNYENKVFAFNDNILWSHCLDCHKIKYWHYGSFFHRNHRGGKEEWDALLRAELLWKKRMGLSFPA